MALGLFLGCASPAQAGLDLDRDGFDDLWELIYQAKGLAPAADPDHDGYTTAEEHAAGTDPLDPLSFPSRPRFLPAVQGDLGGINPGEITAPILQWASVPGKQYRVERRLSIAGSEGPWILYHQVIAASTQIRLPVEASGSTAYFRLITDDADSDSDGLSDYDEALLGTNPASAHSQRQDTPDLQRVQSSWTQPSIVSLGVLDASISEGWPDPGLIAIRRTGGIAPLTVRFSLGGTATPEIDYHPSVSSEIRFDWGVREVWVEFTPLADNHPNEGDESIELQLLNSPDYQVAGTNRVVLILSEEPDAGHPGPKEAARFLIQAAWGPDQDSPDDPDDLPQNVQELMALGYDAWLTDQFSRPINKLQPWVDWAASNGAKLEIYGNWKENSWWNRVMGVAKIRPDAPTTTLYDPLRQRMAFALSEILVVSDRPEALAVEQPGMANYYDLMVQHAFGNYRDLLYDVALHPVMGIYLSHLGNRKANPATGLFPDENFAREIMQLFTIGLWELNPDGTRRLDPDGAPIPTYNNRDITELARVFTGLSFGNNLLFVSDPRDYTRPMKMWDDQHDCDAKSLLQGRIVLPARAPSPGNTGTAGLADVREAVEGLFQHPNTGPFVCRQLIQRFITSNPSTGYVARVAAVFANNGAGTRGDLKAVLRAILLDPEARDPASLSRPEWGKLREPVARVVNLAHAFNAASRSGWYLLDQFTLDHLQDPMNAPSVFNFFLPNHSPPGPLSEGGWVAPEFQLINASSAVTGPNYFWNAVYGGLHRWGAGNPDYSVQLNLDQELALVVPKSQIALDSPPGPGLDPDPLLRRLDLAMTGGTLIPQQFQIIREAILRISPATWQWHRERLRLAIYLIATSPEFNVLR